ncbi:PREDICTED: fasciclin-like arabinogalactan protein 3 [Tarenaya hassleriana]|uniref:fasciclin-like arabinogalactan protein 3 n=1 Tax=Tarenaya hassleriana TaxID=28532 RepID=UPI00053C61F6|nr:PREDICTED: fasciclin-like arabinogalactan protein 3 [Tarenaya hassleriana]
MDLKASPFLPLAILLILSSTTISALNITRVLEKFPNFSTMNELFTETGVAATINQHQTITVLAVDNGAIGSISARPEEEQKNILMTHVVLDYFDELKLKGLKDRSNMFTTLYQTTGLGEQQNGFLNCTNINGTLAFGSAVKGAPLNARYVTTVFQNPYNLSVIQISTPIVAPGLGSPIQAPPPPPIVAPGPGSPVQAPPPPPIAAPEHGSPAQAPPPPPAPAPKKVVKAPAPAPSGEDDDSDSSPPPKTAPPRAPSKGDDDSSAGSGPAPSEGESEPPSSLAPSAGSSFGAALLIGLVASFAGF